MKFSFANNNGSPKESREIAEISNTVGECPFCKKFDNLSNHLASCLVFSSEASFKPIKRPPQLFFDFPKFHKLPIEDEHNKPEFWHVTTQLADPVILI